MSAYRKALREAKKRYQTINGNPMPEFKPIFISKFCPKCGAKRNMMLWGSGARHVTAKCVQCRTEWVFVSPYKDDPLKTWKDEDGVLVGEMKKTLKNVVRWVGIGEKI